MPSRSRSDLSLPLLKGYTAASVKPLRGRMGSTDGPADIVWAALDEMSAENRWSLPGHIDAAKTIEHVLAARYKDREVDGCVLFAAIEYCAHILEMQGKPEGLRQVERSLEDIPDIIRGVLAAGSVVDAPATHSKGSMYAVHYASGLGLVSVLEVLLAAKLESLGAEPGGEEQSAFLNVKTRNERGLEHYAPIHDAVWFKREEATIWLLENQADPNSQNLFGFTPLHIVASGRTIDFVDILVEAGADLQQRDQRGENPLAVAVSRPHFPLSKFHLLAVSANEENCSFLRYLKDIYTLAVENEEAAHEFVEVLLGRHDTEFARNDCQDDRSSSDASGDDEQEQPRLTSFMRSVDTATARESHDSEDTLAMMAEVMDKAPRAAALILDVLVGDPVVQNPEHHPLPCRANMWTDGCEESMICDYRPDSCEVKESTGTGFVPWRKNACGSSPVIRTQSDKKAAGREPPAPEGAGKEPSTEGASRATQRRKTAAKKTLKWSSLRRSLLRQIYVTQRLQEGVLTGSRIRLPCWKFSTRTMRSPAWHDEIAPLPRTRNDDKEIDIQVLKMPDVLDVRILRVLANTPHLSLFAEKTVQGIVNCLWHRLVKHGVFMEMVLDVVTLATLFGWISMAELAPRQQLPLQRTCWVVTVATGLKELANLLCALRVCTLLQRSMVAYVLSVDVLVDLGITLFLLLLAWCTHEDFQVPHVGWGRSVVSLNVFLRWSKITYNCRSRPKVGPKLVCVLKSFLPMKEMMLITTVVFFGFAAAAVLIKDDEHGECGDHCLFWVILSLFKALLLGDGDGFEDLTQLPGADRGGVFASLLIVGGTVIFTVSVLNLFIAIYSNEYDRKEKQSELLFFKERAGICLRHLMEPLWPTWQQQPEWFWRFWGRRCKSVSAESFVRRAVAGTTLCLTLLAALLAELLSLEYLPVLLVASVMLLLQAASKRCDWVHTPRRDEGADHFYLWICSRASFSSSDFQVPSLRDASRRMEDVQDTLRQVARGFEKQMVEMRRDFQALRADVSAEVSALKHRGSPPRPNVIIASPDASLEDIRALHRHASRQCWEQLTDATCGFSEPGSTRSL